MLAKRGAVIMIVCRNIGNLCSSKTAEAAAVKAADSS